LNVPEPGGLKPLLDRLGIRHGASVLLASDYDAGFVSLLRQRARKVVRRNRGPFDVIFVHVENTGELARLQNLGESLSSAGAIWVTRRKGTARKVRDTDIIDAARQAGLVDNKIASFSEELAAMRLVIPLSRR
jgi:phage FluMu protein gp41